MPVALAVSCRNGRTRSRDTAAPRRELPGRQPRAESLRPSKGRAVTFRVPGSRGSGSRPVVLPRWPRFVVPAVIIVVAVAILIAVVAGIWTDYLWYSSVHQTRVFDTTYSTKWLLFVVAAVLMTGVVGANIALAYRLRPAEVPDGPAQQSVDAYRQAIDPHPRTVVTAPLSLLGRTQRQAAGSSSWARPLFVHEGPL